MFADKPESTLDTLPTLPASDSEIHPWQRAGLGLAPFRCVGSAERVYQACQGAPCQAGGNCHYCGAGIRYAAIIRSSDGKVFDVGLDCVKRVDWTAHREALGFFAAERKRRAWEAGSAEREREAYTRAQQKAARLREESEREAAYRASEPELCAAIDLLLPIDGFPGDFAAKCLGNIRGNGSPAKPYDGETDSEADTRTRAKLWELRAERRATGFVGEVGKRVTLRVRYLGFVAFDTQYGTQRIFKFEHTRDDGSHALLTWKSATFFMVGEQYAHEYLGAEVVITASVKAQAPFRGIDQTSILRGKVKAG